MAKRMNQDQNVSPEVLKLLRSTALAIGNEDHTPTTQVIGPSSTFSPVRAAVDNVSMNEKNPVIVSSSSEDDESSVDLLSNKSSIPVPPPVLGKITKEDFTNELEQSEAMMSRITSNLDRVMYRKADMVEAEFKDIKATSLLKSETSERALAEGQRLMEDCYEKKMQELRLDQATRLKKKLAAVKESLGAELEDARAKLAELKKRLAISERERAEKGQRSTEDALAQNKRMEELGRLDDEEGTASRATVIAHLVKEAVLLMELRKKFVMALEPLFGKPVEVDTVYSVFYKRATCQASVGRFTFLVDFTLSPHFPKHRPSLLLESSQERFFQIKVVFCGKMIGSLIYGFLMPHHFDAHGVPVKSRNLTEYPCCPRWEESEMAGQIFDFVAEEGGLRFKKYCNQLNQQ